MALRRRLTSTAVSQSAASIASNNAWTGEATLQRIQRFSGRSPVVFTPLVVSTIKNSPTATQQPLIERATAATRAATHAGLLATTKSVITPNQVITGQTSSIGSTVESTRRNLTARTSDATSKTTAFLLSSFGRIKNLSLPRLR